MLPVSWDTIRLFLHVLAAVAVSGVAAALHARARSAAGLAVFGALTGVSGWLPCSSGSCWPADGYRACTTTPPAIVRSTCASAISLAWWAKRLRSSTTRSARLPASIEPVSRSAWLT